jgi:hypothetical protein
MSRLVASDHALRLLPALAQRPGGVRPVDAAGILEIPFSSAERALGVLSEDGLVEQRDRRIFLADTARAIEAVRFALAFLAADDALGVLVRANPAVEFCGIDDGGALIVIRRFAEPADEARLDRAVAELRGFRAGQRIEFIAKSELRDQLLGDVAPRVRAQGMRVLIGSIDRTFPDRTRHGDLTAPWLGRVDERVRMPSQRRLRELARRHGLRRIVAFGSVTRTDFRPDSDLDLLVEPAPGRHLGLRQRVEFLAEAEQLFERDVDLVAHGEARPSVADRIEQEGVVLYGPAA